MIIVLMKGLPFRRTQRSVGRTVISRRTQRKFRRRTLGTPNETQDKEYGKSRLSMANMPSSADDSLQIESICEHYCVCVLMYGRNRWLE